MKRLEVCQKYFATRHIFNSFLGVSSGDETLRLILDYNIIKDDIDLMIYVILPEPMILLQSYKVTS